MSILLVKQASCLKGEISLPGDKSIAHRSIIISAITRGKTTIRNFPFNKDCLYTVKAFKKLGIRIKSNYFSPLETKIRRKRDMVSLKGFTIIISGKGLYGLKRPKNDIFVGDSGTTLRLLLGVLAGQDFETKLVAGRSLSLRPMLRVTAPLRFMGAEITANRETLRNLANRIEEYPPITIRGGNLKPIIYRMPVASAQVKSAILLAGLYTKGATQIIEPVKTRNHTECMLKLFKADIKVKQNKIVIKGKRELASPGIITIPGDISSASFFIVPAVIITNSQVLIRRVGLNPTRAGIIKVLKRMRADIKIQSRTFGKVRDKIQNFEPMGDIIVKSSLLRGTTVKKEEIPSLIDELPILMVAACFAKGKTILEGVSELRVKETDRIRSMSENLIKMGAKIEVLKVGKLENIVIKGVNQLKGAKVKSFQDHRTAMSMVVAALKAKGKSQIDDVSCINKSFPEFLRILKSLVQ